MGGTPTSQLCGQEESAQRAPDQIRLALLGTFDLSIANDSVPVPMNGQRLLAFLALHGRWVLRSFVAGSLWIDSTDDRAAASLRSALWRLNREARIVETSGEQIRLAPDVGVDVDIAIEQAHTLLDPDCAEAPRLGDLLLQGDVLPDWYDDWVTLERERFRQLRIHALERLCDLLIDARRFGEAIEAGLAVARIEPLRESAHRTLVRIHLAEGNHVEAVAQYKRFRVLIRQELGLEPSPQMTELVLGLTAR
jgi:DNA-binding SARP family transcriptional activator